MVFFASGRTKQAPGPFYSNLDQPATLAYGFEVWAIYLAIMLPQRWTDVYVAGVPTPAPSQTLKLAELLIQGTVLNMQLGQESQVEFPVHRFGAGGGIWSPSGGSVYAAVNGDPIRTHVMVLPEPIEMPRTQALAAEIRFSPQALATLGSVAVPGVGRVLAAYPYLNLDTPPAVTTPDMPFQVQLGLIGKRIKRAQYGQTT
jgi:hypothetical protein